ncbi:MAG: hypothetical protein AAF907_14155, partial [Planctomycetota bacterium]
MTLLHPSRVRLIKTLLSAAVLAAAATFGTAETANAQVRISVGTGNLGYGGFNSFRPSYGYGIRISQHKLASSDQVLTLLQHGGGINGFNCHFVHVVDQDITIAILDNISRGEFHQPMATAFINILNDEPFRQPTNSLFDTLRPIASEQGGSAAVAKYRSLKESSPSEYDFDNEEALNQLGYFLLQQNRTKDAIEVFQQNVAVFPEAF